jgi:DNA primase
VTEVKTQEALDILKSPDLLQIIVSDMRVMGFTGDDRELLLYYLTAVSRLNSRGLYTCFTGIEGQGKQLLFPLLEDLVNPSQSMVLDRISPNSFFNGLDVRTKCLLVPKMDSKGLLAILLKDKKLHHIGVATVDGEKKAVEKRIDFEGSAFIQADKKMDKSLFSLFYAVKLNEKFPDTITFGSEDAIDEVIARHHAMQGYLKRKTTFFPDSFKGKPSFPSAEVRYRRDHPRFLNLISTVCFLRQYQKEVKHIHGDDEFIEIDCTDYETAYQIFTHCAAQDDTFNKDDLKAITTPEQFENTAG